MNMQVADFANTVDIGEPIRIASNSFADQASFLERFSSNTRDLDAIFQGNFEQMQRPGERAAFVNEMFNMERAGKVEPGTVAGVLGRAAGSSTISRDGIAESLDLLQRNNMLDASQLVNASPGHQLAIDTARGDNPVDVNSRIADMVNRSGNGELRQDYTRAALDDLQGRSDELAHAEKGDRFSFRDSYNAVVSTATAALADGDQQPALDTLNTMWQDPTLRTDFAGQADDKAGLSSLINQDYGVPGGSDLTETMFQELVNINPEDQKAQDNLHQYFRENIDRIGAEATDPGYGRGKLYEDGTPVPITQPEIAGFNESNDGRLVQDYVGNVLLNDNLSDTQVQDRFQDIRNQVDKLTDRTNDRDLPFAERKKAARELHTMLKGVANGVEDAVVRAKANNDRGGLAKLSNSVGTVLGLLGPKGAAAGAGLIVLSNYIDSPNVGQRLQGDFVNSAIAELNEPHGANYDQDATLRDIVQNGQI